MLYNLFTYMYNVIVFSVNTELCNYHHWSPTGTISSPWTETLLPLIGYSANPLALDNYQVTFSLINLPILDISYQHLI